MVMGVDPAFSNTGGDILRRMQAMDENKRAAERQKLFDLIINGAGGGFVPDPVFTKIPPDWAPPAFIPQPQPAPEWFLPDYVPPALPGPYSGDYGAVPKPPLLNFTKLTDQILRIRELLKDLSWTEEGCWCSHRNLSTTDHSQTCTSIKGWLDATKHFSN